MTRQHWLIPMLVALAALAGGCSGASSADDSDLDAQRARFLLQEEPSGALGVLDAQQAFQGPAEMVVLGQIGGVAEPWTQGRAEFVIADPMVLMEADQHGDCADGCAFCSDKNQPDTQGRALVQFLDEQDRVLPLDARRLFSLAERQTVVVQGQVQQDALGNLVISASGLYVRR